MKSTLFSSIERYFHPRIIWAIALFASSLISILAVFRGGYIGPDYDRHLKKMLTFADAIDFTWVHPPPYYLFGHALFWLLGVNNRFIITLSIIQILINSIALWWFFVYTEPRFRSRILHLSLALFLSFLPVRVIHATTMGDDWTTIPVIVLLLFLFEKFQFNGNPSMRYAALLGIALTLGFWSKYSFLILIPAFFVIYIFLWINRRWKFRRFIAVCALTFILPSCLVLVTIRLNSADPNSISNKMWIPKGGVPGQPDMDFSDLLLVKANDLELFKAPEYFMRFCDGCDTSEGIRTPHKYSYLALSHMNVFTDTMNLFQDLPLAPWINTYLIPDFKRRAPWKTPVMQASMLLGTIWTGLALVGTPFVFVGGILNLFKGRLRREDVLAILGSTYFLMLFLPIPYVLDGTLSGFWTPRLILVPLLFFFLSAFLLIDKIAPGARKTAFVILGLVVVQSLIEVVMLV